MKCLCIQTYFDRNTFAVVFQRDKYYQHLGVCEMLGENNQIVGFGKLENWKEYFEEPSDTRERKLNELGI